jgi:hypothetical protein
LRAVRIFSTSVSRIIGFLHQLQRRDQNRDCSPQKRVHTLDVTRFVGVGEMLAVPCQKNITLVIGGQSQVESIPKVIGWH